ncbi:KH domain-containing protein C56G2.1 [Toxocara canis]|uniref:KH domain-containing protein C56G2.1 n=1 Tax=Toxocara canis TaxID=6265 RepID=A0A0B2VCJ4_TOXCA|nr:KH domain-containing protein C56G2.1 [Toxocara canis]
MVKWIRRIARLSTILSMKRSVILLAGGLTMATAFAWVFARKRSAKMSDVQADDSTLVSDSRVEEAGTENSEETEEVMQKFGALLPRSAGRRNYRKRETHRKNHVHAVEAIAHCEGGGDCRAGNTLPTDQATQKAMSITKICDEWRAVNETRGGKEWLKKRDEVQSFRNAVDQNKNMIGACGDSILIQPRNTENAHGQLFHDQEMRGDKSISSVGAIVGAARGRDVYRTYEFEVPNTLVGLIIGIKGKTIKMETHQICIVEGTRENVNKCMRMLRRRFPADRFPELNLEPVLPPPIPLPAHFFTKPSQELSTRNDVAIAVRPHHTDSKMETHQICIVEGTRENVNKCMRMLRRRFPADRFPELNLEPVLPPPIPLPAHFFTKPSQLALPEGCHCEVLVCSIVDAGHFFVQQPAHPSYQSLSRLDCYMFAVYSISAGIPQLPKPCERKCVALVCYERRMP